MKAFIVCSEDLSVKRGKRVQSLKSFFPDQFFDLRVWIDIGLKYECSHKILAQNSI